jgi:hypothetical protein
MIAQRSMAAALLFAISACSEDASPVQDSPAAAPVSRAVDMDSVAAVQRAESLAVAQDAWNRSEVTSRLEAAGLVVGNLERVVRPAGFSVEGITLSVSGGELVVFLYESAALRSADTEALDSASAAPHGASPQWPGRPRLITSGNLAAVLLSDREQLAERVRNVLTARHVGGG